MVDSKQQWKAWVYLAPALVLLLAGACSKNSGGGGVKLRNDTDSVAYVIGMNVGANLLKMDSTINVNAVCEGIRDMSAAIPDSRRPMQRRSI